MLKTTVADEIKEKLHYSVNFQYRILKDNTVLTVLTDEELEEIESLKEFATKEELFDLIKIYHHELKRLRSEVKEIVDNE